MKKIYRYWQPHTFFSLRAHDLKDHLTSSMLCTAPFILAKIKDGVSIVKQINPLC